MSKFTEFSKKLLESSSLKKVDISNKNTNTGTVDQNEIIKGHGSIIELSNQDKLYDLRPYFEKPIIGHSHPLILRSTPLDSLSVDSQIPVKTKVKEIYFFRDDAFVSHTQLEQSNFEFNFFTTQNNVVSFDSFNKSKYFQYLDTVIVKGGRIKVLKEILKVNLKNICGEIEIEGLVIKLPANFVSQNDLYQSGIYTSSSCFQNRLTKLYLPVAITDNQVKDFCFRLKQVVTKVLSS